MALIHRQTKSTTVDVVDYTELESLAAIIIIISPPENDSFRKNFCFAVVYFFSFFRRVISELRRPIGAKFCTVLGAAFNFIIPVQNFGKASPKSF